MKRVIYLGFVILVGLTNPINLNKDEKTLDLYRQKALYLGI
jgi:hypothetical protein